ncbi:uncharacterized protein si:ch211-180a12.2 [Brienomyrus brachyistius]|uniref:uncharacterized protein si:ch211-180a12.2 n=1 Tax=Brienomyrus brachyistius TaxID=42636 RepID=UPI0020B38C27|nr:uncharacterized protein si:ch211-180a12.2 [Brienomyrus brachyistius]
MRSPVNCITGKDKDLVLHKSEAMKFKVLVCFCLLTVIKHVSLTDIWAQPNSSVLLPCNVEGDEIELSKSIFLLGVSWLHNGSVIASSGADGNRTEEGFSLKAGTLETGAFSLTLHSVSASKQGEYVCRLSYNNTLLYSVSVTLCILALPSLSIPSTVAVIHRPSRIECRAEHFTPPLIDFTWVRAGVVVKPPESITAVNRTSSGFFWAVSSLTLIPTDQDKDVNFSCVVKHTASEEPIVLNFHLNLIYLPTVTLSALPLTSQFSPVTLSCDIEGFYPEAISVSWFQNGSLVPDMPLAWPGPGGTFCTRHFYTLRAEDMRRGTEVQCAVRHPAVAKSVSATMTLSATGPNATEPVMTKSAKASVAVVIISLAMIFLLCFGFSWKKRDEKEKSLVVSGIILPPRIIVGRKGRVTISVEGRRVDRVQVTWFLNDIPISDTSQRAPTENEKNPLLPPNGKSGYYKLHTQYPIPSGNSRTMQLFSSVTFIPDIAVHKGTVFKCQISYKGKDQMVAERVSDKLMLLAAPEVSEIKFSEPADDTGVVTLTVEASRFHPALITFRWFCKGAELSPIAPPPSLATPRPSIQGFFSAVSQCKLPWEELEKGQTKVWVTVHHMAMKVPIIRQTPGFIKMPIVSEISSSCPAYTSSPEESVTLQCEITGFFPPEISITWWEDGEQEIMEGKDSWGPLLTDGSTYRLTATLRIGQCETKVEKSERDIVCRVMHCSLQEPIEKHWRQRHIALPVIPSSLSVQWKTGGVGEFSLLLSGGHPYATLLWAAGGATLSPLISTESNEDGNDGSRQLKSMCILERRTGTGRRPAAGAHCMGSPQTTKDATSNYSPIDMKLMDDVQHVWIKKTRNRPGTPVVKRATQREDRADERQEERKRGSDLSQVNIVHMGKGEERLRVTVEITHPGLLLPVHLTWMEPEE